MLQIGSRFDTFDHLPNDNCKSEPQKLLHFGSVLIIVTPMLIFKAQKVFDVQSLYVIILVVLMDNVSIPSLLTVENQTTTKTFASKEACVKELKWMVVESGKWFPKEDSLGDYYLFRKSINNSEFGKLAAEAHCVELKLRIY